MTFNQVKRYFWLTLFAFILLTGIYSLVRGPRAAGMFAVPTANSFSVTINNVAASAIQLQGADADGTALTYAIVSNPASGGTLNNLNTSTGAVVFTPTSGYTGTTTFTYKVTSGGQDSTTATVTVTVTNQRTRVIDTLLHPDGTPRQGTVTFILVQESTAAGSGSGLIPVSSSVSALLNGAGQFDVQLSPSATLSPQSYYQLWFADKTTLRRESLGVYDIPASTVSITLTGRRVTDTNKGARYLFASSAQVEALVNALANGAANYGAHPILGAGHNDTETTGIGTGSLLVRSALGKWLGLAPGTGFLKAAGGLPSYATLADGDIPTTLSNKTLVSPTISTALTVNGNVTATRFYGDGANLTNLPGTTSVTETIAFTTAIPFNKWLSNLGQQSVSGALTFSKNVSNARAGYGAIVRLVANGTNVPDLSAFRQTSGSSGWDNRTGHVNVLAFFHDGTDYWLNIFQELNGAVADTTIPTIVSAVVTNAAPTQVVLTYNEPLDVAFVPTTSAFTITGKTVSAVAVTGSTVTVTVSSAFIAGDTITLNYVPGTNAVRDTSGNLAAQLTAYAVSNQIYSLVDLAFTTNNGLTQTGTTWSGASLSNGLADSYLPANQDGYVQVKFDTSTSACAIGFNLQAVSESITTDQVEIYIRPSGNGAEYYKFPYELTGTGTGVIANVGDYYRLRRASGVIYAEKSTNGTTWTSIYTYTTNFTAALYPTITVIGSGADCRQPKGYGVIPR